MTMPEYALESHKLSKASAIRLLNLAAVCREGDANAGRKGEGLNLTTIKALAKAQIEQAMCYDCAWLSLTALSTITCNLWL
jgi:hypothetical protein